MANSNAVPPSGRSGQNVVIPGEVPGRDEQQGGQQQQARPQAQAQPQSSPQQKDPDFGRRKQGFKSIFSRLTQTPEGRLALLQAGVSLGQGHGLPTAIGRGANTAIRAKKNQAEAQQTARETQLEARKTESEIRENEAQTKQALTSAGVDEARINKLGAETMQTLSELRGGSSVSDEKKFSAFQDLLKSNMESIRENAALSGDMDEAEMLDRAIRTTQSQYSSLLQSTGQQGIGQQGGQGSPSSELQPVTDQQGKPLVNRQTGEVLMEDARGRQFWVSRQESQNGNSSQDRQRE